MHADGHRFKSFAIATLFLVCRRFGQAVRLPASSSAGAACFCAGQRAITPRHAVILCPDGRAGRPRSQQQETPTVRSEPTTTRLRATRPTSWARRASGRRRGKGGGQLHASPTHGAWPARPSCCARSTIARLPRGPNTIGRRRGWATLFMGASQRHGSKLLCAAKPKARSSCAAALPPPLTVWPNGLRRWLQAPVRQGAGSSPAAVICVYIGSDGSGRSRNDGMLAHAALLYQAPAAAAAWIGSHRGRGASSRARRSRWRVGPYRPRRALRLLAEERQAMTSAGRAARGADRSLAYAPSQVRTGDFRRVWPTS